MFLNWIYEQKGLMATSTFSIIQEPGTTYFLSIPKGARHPQTFAAMKFRTLVALAAQSGLLHTGNAQSLQYVTELVTECFDPWQTDLEYTASATDAWSGSAPQHTSGTVEYQMPECTCGCVCGHALHTLY